MVRITYLVCFYIPMSFPEVLKCSQMFWSRHRYRLHRKTERKERGKNKHLLLLLARFCSWPSHVLCQLKLDNSLCQSVQCIWIPSESSLKQRLISFIWKHSALHPGWWLRWWSSRIVCPATCPHQINLVTVTEALSLPCATSRRMTGGWESLGTSSVST